MKKLVIAKNAQEMKIFIWSLKGENKFFEHFESLAKIFYNLLMDETVIGISKFWCFLNNYFEKF